MVLMSCEKCVWKYEFLFLTKEARADMQERAILLDFIQR